MIADLRSSCPAEAGDEQVVSESFKTIPGMAQNFLTCDREQPFLLPPDVPDWLPVLHFTPTSSSWLNLVERWFAELTSKKLRRGAHRSVRQLNTDIRARIDTWNDNPRAFVWTKTADQILDSIARYCDRINESRN